MNCQNKFHREYTMINQSNFIIRVYFLKKIIHRLLFSNFLNSVNLLRTFITVYGKLVAQVRAETKLSGPTIFQYHQP